MLQTDATSNYVYSMSFTHLGSILTKAFEGYIDNFSHGGIRLFGVSCKNVFIIGGNGTESDKRLCDQSGRTNQDSTIPHGSGNVIEEKTGLTNFFHTRILPHVTAIADE